MAFKGNSAKEVVFTCLEAYLEQRSPEKTLECLTKNVVWIGSSSFERAVGKEQVRALIVEEIAKDSTPLEGMCTGIEEISVTDDVTIVSMDIKIIMKNESSLTLDIRGTFNCVKTAKGYKIAGIHVSVPTGLQEDGEYFPVSFGEKKLEDIRNEAMFKSIVVSGCEQIIKLDVRNNSYRIFSSDGGTNDIFPSDSGDYKRALFDYVNENVDREDLIYVKKELSPENIVARLSDEQVFRIYYKTVKQDCVRNKKIEVFYIDKWKGQVAIVRTDVTDSVAHEQHRNDMLASALRSAEKANKAKLDFLSRMSHEVRTPLNSIVGMCEIASQSAGNIDVISDCVAKIGVSSKYLTSLVNDILDMSGGDVGKFTLRREPFHLSALINSVNNIICAQAEVKGIKYNVSVSKNEDDEFRGDFVKMQQMLLNILGNAVKFTPSGGHVDFSVSELLKTGKGSVLRFVVTDSGCGIREEFLPNIFVPFAREDVLQNTPGTGLGLPISKSIIDMMNGKIKVNSVIGAGTEFSIEVELETAPKSGGVRRIGGKINYSMLKALVIDDDIVTGNHAVKIFKDIGVDVQFCESPSLGLELAQTAYDKGRGYDVFLIGWRMAEMGGIALAARLRVIVGAVPTLIMMSAYDWKRIEIEARLAGVSEFLCKPMVKSSLVGVIEKTRPGRKIKKDTADCPYDFKGKRLLLAEDDPGNTEVTQKLLEAKGFEVELATDGIKALEKFARNAPGYYNAVLMDIRMPLMDGLTAARNIRMMEHDDAKRIPIIAMTAHAFESDMDRSLAVGMNAHVAKPINSQDLCRVLNNLIWKK